jgi:hypothetical protein
MTTDVWIESNEGTNFETIAGFVLLSSYYDSELGCGDIDFSSTILPVVAATASLDGIIPHNNAWDENNYSSLSTLPCLLTLNEAINKKWSLKSLIPTGTRFSQKVKRRRRGVER